MKPLKAIETFYKGYKFRSRLEARWAVFFDALGIMWEYEKEGYDLGEAGYYLPDFWLPGRKCFIEIKGNDESAYNAQDKITALSEQSEKHVFIMAGPIGEHLVISDNNFIAPKKPILSHYSQETLVRRLFPDEKMEPDNDKWGPSIRCPICGEEYVHLGPVTKQESDSGTAWDGRGSAARIEMRCEAGCNWTLRFGFHKGNTYLGLENLAKSFENLDEYIFGISKWSDYKLAINKAKQARFEHREKP